MQTDDRALFGKEIAELLDYLPMVAFYSKDLEGRFLHCNACFEELYHLERGGSVGKTDYDLHPPEIASRYRAEDRRVMESGQPLPNQVWMVPDAKGTLRWWSSSKTPLRSKGGEVSGVAGVMYEVSHAGGVMKPYERLEGAFLLLHQDFSNQLRASDLAGACHLSVSQFNRVFRELMGRSPNAYLTELRLDAAKSLLSETDMPVSQIAVEVGFYDASIFGKKFRESEGVTPRAYRIQLRELLKIGGEEPRT